MPLLVYKYSDYDHTAEREQYRALCKQLKGYYGQRDEICIYVANYNIYDSELDALLIKQDAIISIEYKNYGGEITAVDNGQWTTEDGTIIKGGSRKSVYQQAKVNHIAVKNGFKDGMFLPVKVLREVAALVVFHQPIVLDNQLPLKTQSWLHVCDEDTFMEKVQDITNSKMDLSEEDMLRLVERMNLLEEKLDENYSNKEFLEGNDDYGYEEEEEIEEEGGEDVADNQAEPDKVDLQTSLNFQPEGAVKSVSAEEGIAKDIEILRNSNYEGNGDKEEVDDYLGWNEFLKKDISLFLALDIEVEVYSGYRNLEILRRWGLNHKCEMVYVLSGDGVSEYADRLGRKMHKKISIIDRNYVYWTNGDILTSLDVGDKSIEEAIVNSGDKDVVRLPQWLDDVIYTQLEGRYEPDYMRYAYNKDLNHEEVKVYLGTYCPRSYAEAIAIGNSLCECTNIVSLLGKKDTIKILDFGCGTGGELIGVLNIIEKYLKDVRIVEIYAVDGNNKALRVFEKMIECSKSHFNIDVSHQVVPLSIYGKEDLEEFKEIIQEEFDLLISFKAIGELLSMPGMSSTIYYDVVALLLSKVKKDGIVIIEDVTTKSEKEGEFLPYIMSRDINDFIKEHSQYATLLPMECRQHELNCNSGCFFQQQIKISHSKRGEDLSKVTYRIVGYRNFIDKISINKKINFLRNTNCKK